MSGFNDENENESDRSALLQSETALTAETFGDYVETLASTLEENKGKLASLLTPEAKRAEIMETQKEVMASYCGSWEVGKSSLVKLVSSKTVDSTYETMNNLIKTAYLNAVMDGEIVGEMKNVGELEADKILTFLDLCNSYVQTEENLSLLKSAFAQEAEIKLSIKAVNQKLVELQHEVMNKLGWDVEWATDELSMSRERYASDANLLNSLNNFITTMTQISRTVIQEMTEKYSRELDDGVTKVVSSNSREVDPEAVGGRGQMEERMEEVPRETLKQMAVIEQDILAELMSFSPGELQAQMQICLQIRQSFMQQISLIPASERANFMLTVSPEVKRRLLMIKIWESYESKRGGRELKRVEKNTEDM